MKQNISYNQNDLTLCYADPSYASDRIAVKIQIGDIVWKYSNLPYKDGATESFLVLKIWTYGDCEWIQLQKCNEYGECLDRDVIQEYVGNDIYQTKEDAITARKNDALYSKIRRILNAIEVGQVGYYEKQYTNGFLSEFEAKEETNRQFRNRLSEDQINAIMAILNIQ